MTDARIDLHTHSLASDGEFAAAEVARARARGRARRLGALRPRHRRRARRGARRGGRGSGCGSCPGIELSAFLDTKEIHVLGHFIDPGPPVADASSRTSSRSTAASACSEIVEKLAALGVHVRVEDIEKWSGGKTIGRPHVARAIVEAGVVATVKEAFDRFLGEGQARLRAALPARGEEAVRARARRGRHGHHRPPRRVEARAPRARAAARRRASTGSRCTTSTTTRRSARSTCASPRASDSSRPRARTTTASTVSPDRNLGDVTMARPRTSRRAGGRGGL